MQTSVPELTDLAERAASHVSTCTAPTCASPAASPRTACSPAGWPSAACGSSSSTTAAGTSTTNLPDAASAASASDTDQASAALVTDLKQRGLLDDTLVDLGGRVRPHDLLPGRADRRQLRPRPSPRCFTIWMAGGGVKAGHRPTARPTTSPTTSPRPGARHDLHATILHLLGIDHDRLTFRSQGRDFRLTDVAGEVIGEAIA